MQFPSINIMTKFYQMNMMLARKAIDVIYEK